MFININMLMELHKARETELVRQGESSRFQRLSGPSKLKPGKRFMQAMANALVFWD